MFAYLALLALFAAFVWPSCLASGLCILSCTLSETESACSGRCCALQNSTAAPSHPHIHNCPQQCGVFAILDSQNRQVILLDALKRPCFLARKPLSPFGAVPATLFPCCIHKPLRHVVSNCAPSFLLEWIAAACFVRSDSNHCSVSGLQAPHPGCRYSPAVFCWLIISAQLSFIRMSSFSAGTGAAQHIASVVSSVGTLVLWCSL